MEKSKTHIIILEHSGFPYGLASMEKLKLISKALILDGFSVLIISRKPAMDCNLGKIAPSGTIDGINYSYTARPYCNKVNSFVKVFANIYGLLGQLVLLLRLKFNKKLDFVYVSYTPFPLLFLYRFLSKLLKFKIVLSIAELHIAVKTNSRFKRLNNRLYDRYAFGLSDGVIVISDKLSDLVKKLYPNKPIIKIPVLCDYSIFDNSLPAKLNEKYFLFCGGAGYFELIDFIIKSFEHANLMNDSKLHLVVNGNNRQMLKVNKRIKNSIKSSSILLYSNLQYEELVRMYKNALGLLIPLRETDQDRARFPHKIGEYLASKRPIITNQVGEISNYFRDEMNALVCNNYEPLEFSKKMEFVERNLKKADQIGMNGYETGITNFDYSKYSSVLSTFIRTL